MKRNKSRIAVTVFQTENLKLNALKIHFCNTVATITTIQTEKATVDKNDVICTQNNSVNKHLCNAWT